MKNTSVYLQTSLDTVPKSVAATGTISSAGTQITGVGTLFTTEATQGDFLFDNITNKEVRRIVSISSDTILYVDEAFTAPIAGATFAFTKSPLAFIGIALPTGVTALVDGAAIPAQTTLNWSRTDKQGTGTSYIDPVVVEPTGSAVITTLK